MAREYAPQSTREYAPTPDAPKFTPDEDTVYSPEGIPLITPSTQAEPTGAGKVLSGIATDVVGAPVRAAMSTAKPFADVAKWLGYQDPINALTQTDVGVKKQSDYLPDWLPVPQGPIGSVASLAGDFAGLKGLGKSALGLGEGAAEVGRGMLQGAEKSAPEIVPALQKVGSDISSVAGKTSKWIAEHPFWGQSVAGGAATGALGANPTAGAATDEAMMGALFGAGFHGLGSGAGAMFSPALKRFKELKAMGLSNEEILKDTTIGQLLGGGVQKMENLLGDIPFGGVRDKIVGGIKSLNQSLAEKKAANEIEKEVLQGQANKVLGTPGSTGTLDTMAAKTKQQKLADLEAAHAKADADLQAHINEKEAALKESESNFHRPFVDRAMSNLPPEYHVTPGAKGHEMIAEGQKNISKAYEDSLKDIGSLKLPESVKTELKDVANTDPTSLGGEGSKLHKLLTGKVDSLINATKNGNWLNPKDWQDQLSSLSREAYAAKSPTKTVFEQNYGKALDDLKDKWIGLIEGQAGSDLFKSANKAFHEFKVPEKAASYMSSLKDAGEAKPADLLKAIQSELSTKSLAGGQSEIQQMAEKAYKEMMENRAAHKTFVKDVTNHVNSVKEAELKALKGSDNPVSEFKLIDKNIDLRKDALQNKVDVEKAAKDANINQLSGAIKDIVTSPGENYAEKRGIYNWLGGGALTGSAAGLAHLVGLPIAAGVSAATIGGARGLYSKPVQEWLKTKAVSERPEAIKQLGQAIKQNTPLGALTAVESIEQSKKKPAVTAPGVHVLDPVTGLPINGPKGGLP